MNQALLTRLFRTIDGDADAPLVKIAYSIIEDERQKGHTKLAEKLSSILSKNISPEKNSGPSLKLIKETNLSIPLDRRYKLPLATHVAHEYLRHEMILTPETENKINRIEKEFLARERLAHHGLKPRKKILFYGVSGCGKSMAAERIAWDLGLPFYKVRFDSIISSYLGESASNLQSLFKSVNEFPCVLLLDEFDIIGKQRQLEGNDVGEIHRIVNILLGLLEEYDGDGLFIATTNFEGSLDKALYRRFDDIVELPKPSEKEIIELLTILFSPLKVSKDISLPRYAERMFGLSYAIICKIALDAAKQVVIDSKKEITALALDIAIEENQVFSK